MTTVADAVGAGVHSLDTDGSIRIALLGVGQVGGAVAALLRDPALRGRFTIVRGLVRDVRRERPSASDVPLTSDGSAALDRGPDVVVEALGGLEPARTLVRNALEAGVPVVTANKSLLAAHGDELFEAAARAGVSLRYEAAVLAGVPFLATFARRALARDITGLAGIVNGTTNFILSKMAREGTDFDDALADAQRLGYAEPDPASDIAGIDAAEKLCILLRHFRDWSVRPSEVERCGIAELDATDIDAAAELGAAIKPVVWADWTDGKLRAFCGPALIPFEHLLARIDGVQNAIQLRNRLAGDLFFAGPGAGPVATAATLLDDVEEAMASGPANGLRPWKRTEVHEPASAWFLRIPRTPTSADRDIRECLASAGVAVDRTGALSGEPGEKWLLTHPCEGARLTAARHAGARAIRVLD